MRIKPIFLLIFVIDMRKIGYTMYLRRQAALPAGKAKKRYGGGCIKQSNGMW